MNFKICIALQIKSGNLNENEALIKKAKNAKPDLIEFRFDYIDDGKEITENFAKNLKDLIEPEIPVIFTFRDPNEGGQMKIEKIEHLEILKALIQARPTYLDIEMNTNKEILKDILFLSEKNGTTLIFSYHDFEKTLSYEEGLRVVEDFKDRLMNAFSVDLSSLKKYIYKVIFTAQAFEDNFIPIQLCRTFKEKGEKLVCFCMGAQGIFSRVLCVKSGSLFTFSSIEDKTAPGQIHIDKIRDIHQLLFNEN